MSINIDNLNLLKKEMGSKDAIAFLEFSLPIIVDRECKLQAHLSRRDWEMAQSFKHKILSSLHLYGSHKIKTLLIQLDEVQAGVIDVDLYQEEVSREFYFSVKTIKEWLEHNTSSFSDKNYRDHSIH